MSALNSDAMVELAQELNAPSVVSAADLVLAKLGNARCDDEAVSCCLRCNAVFLARKVNQLRARARSEGGGNG